MSYDNNLSVILNPTQSVARSGLIGCASNGDRDAVKLLQVMKNDNTFENMQNEAGADTLIPENDTVTKAAMAYGTVAWVRHTMTDMLFKALKMSAFVDIGCGYNHRSIAFSRMENKYYYGIDLPAVIGDLRRYIMQIIPGAHLDNRIRLLAVDVTDYDTLRYSINCKGPLFIATEGLMMYLTEKEMITAAQNIRKLLDEFGGVWITNDPFARELNDSVINTLFPGGGDGLNKTLGSLTLEKDNNIIFDNSFINLKGINHERFMQKLGFSSRTIDVGYHTKEIRIPEEIKPAFAKMKYMIFTSSEFDALLNNTVSKSKFSVDSVNRSGEITLRINGRLDTVTSPELIEEFERLMKDPLSFSVTVNMEKCPYISSAGIRAFLIIYKRMHKIGGSFELINLRPEVYDIITTTGMSQFL